MSHRIISRTEWGARHGFGRHTRPLGALGVVLHHTAGADAGESATFDQDAAIVRGVETHREARDMEKPSDHVPVVIDLDLEG